MNASLSTEVPTAADIPVDNPPRDPQSVVKRDEPPRWGKPGPRPKYASKEDAAEANRARARERAKRIRQEDPEGVRTYQRQWRADHPGRSTEYTRRYLRAYQRLKRIAAARGMTAEALLDALERPDA